MPAFRLRVSIRRRSDETGMTLVEVMVAMLVLTVVFSALASVLTVSLRSVHGNESRVRANALANDVLEDLRGLPWAEVGFSQSDHGYTANGWHDDIDHEPTVTFEDEGVDVPSGDRPLPLRDGEGGISQVVRDGVAYTIRTDITWVDDSQTSYVNDFKRFRVTVRWSELGDQRSVTHESLRATPPSELEEGADTCNADDDAAFTSLASLPDLGFIRSPDDSSPGKLYKKVQVDDLGNVTVTSVSSDDIQVNVETSLPVDSVSMSFVDRSNTTVTADLTQTGANDGTEWRLGSSVFESWRFDNGDTTFTFTADFTTECGSSTITTTKTVRYVYENPEIETVDPDAPTHDGDPILCVGETGTQITEPVTVTVDVSGVTDEDELTATGGGFGGQTSAPVVGQHADGVTYEFTIPEGHDVGVAETVISLDFTVLREFDQQSHTRTQDFRVWRCPTAEAQAYGAVVSGVADLGPVPQRVTAAAPPQQSQTDSFAAAVAEPLLLSATLEGEAAAAIDAPWSATLQTVMENERGAALPAAWRARAYAITQDLEALFAAEDDPVLTVGTAEAEAVATCQNGQPVFATASQVQDVTVDARDLSLIGSLADLQVSGEPNEDLTTSSLLTWTLSEIGLEIEAWDTNWDGDDGTTDGSDTVWVNALRISVTEGSSLADLVGAQTVIVSHAQASVDCDAR